MSCWCIQFDSRKQDCRCRNRYQHYWNFKCFIAHYFLTNLLCFSFIYSCTYLFTNIDMNINIPDCTVSYHIISYQSYHIISYHIISYHIISYHIISYHIISYHIISYHIISYHIISYHIIISSYHISYIIYHISYIIYHISYIIYHISYIIYHIKASQENYRLYRSPEL